jgi:hypothetical protein
VDENIEGQKDLGVQAKQTGWLLENRFPLDDFF